MSDALCKVLREELNKYPAEATRGAVEGQEDGGNNSYKKSQLDISNMISDEICFKSHIFPNEYTDGRESMLSITEANSMQRTRESRLMAVCL